MEIETIVTGGESLAANTYLPVCDGLYVTDEAQDALAQVQKHRADHILPGLKVAEVTVKYNI